MNKSNRKIEEPVYGFFNENSGEMVFATVDYATKQCGFNASKLTREKPIKRTEGWRVVRDPLGPVDFKLMFTNMGITE